ncbi:hypothetical protein F5050DRAFT_1316762 [Lentinula boryana]|uniref:Uncharacterized protein n=1 Tax=Lentinula boryana TaxID=40481 RepID=A0ABQ8Q089_9AGAR|nr:hypothetical protein F5050DRAFT_1316762 [Lentinula boryana]
MCLRLLHLFRLYPLYLLLAAALLGVAVVASPVPRANIKTVQRRRPILLRIGEYDWKHSRWKRIRGMASDPQAQWRKVLCISDIRCFGYTSDNVIETISPKTTQRLAKTEVNNDCYRALGARVNLSSFNRAQPSLFESFSSVEKLQDAIGHSINIENDESYIRAILNLMVTKDIVSHYDDQKSLEDNMKPVFLRPNHNLRPLRFGVYDWQKSIWARPKAESEPDFLCFACYTVCLGFDKKQSKVIEILPNWHSIPGEKGHIDTDTHPPLMYKFDHRKGATWSNPDQKHRTLVQFLQDTGDLNDAAGGDIKDPESYIRAVLRYLNLDSVGLIQGYDPTKSLSDLIDNKRKKGGDGQDVGDKEAKRRKGGDVGNGGDRIGSH